MRVPVSEALSGSCRHPDKPKGDYNNDAVSLFIAAQAKAIDQCMDVLNK